MIEFVDNRNHLNIIFDGVVVGSIPAKEENEHTLKYYSEDIDFKLSTKICKCIVTEFPTGLDYWCKYESTLFPNVDFLEIKKESTYVEVKLFISFSWEQWSHPFTILEFLECYKEKISTAGYASKVIKEDDWAALEVYVQITDGLIEKRIYEVILLVKDVYGALTTKLARNNSNSIFVKVFEFPEGLESICVQYLIWFGEFLNNLGIDANVSTESGNEQTAIIVSPVEAGEFLCKIEQLFYQYLLLPYTEYLPVNTAETSLEEKMMFQMLSCQVENFKTQLQMKESVIEMKNISISTLNKSLSNANNELLLLKSMKNVEDITIADGAIRLGEVEWGALKFNPKKIIEAIRNKV